MISISSMTGVMIAVSYDIAELKKNTRVFGLKSLAGSDNRKPATPGDTDTLSIDKEKNKISDLFFSDPNGENKNPEVNRTNLLLRLTSTIEVIIHQMVMPVTSPRISSALTKTILCCCFSVRKVQKKSLLRPGYISTYGADDGNRTHVVSLEG